MAQLTSPSSSAPGKKDDQTSQAPSGQGRAVHESVEPKTVYTLYRGVTGQINDQAHRVWVDFTDRKLCWARYDLPPTEQSRVPLDQLVSPGPNPVLETLAPHATATLEVNVVAPSRTSAFASESRTVKQSVAPPAGSSVAEPAGPRGESMIPQRRIIQVSAPCASLQEFRSALHELLRSRDEGLEQGHEVLKFIQQKLFQYLSLQQGRLMTAEEQYEAAALLGFNLNPKSGVAYLREKLRKTTDQEVGEWLSVMSIQRGGIDPTMLGNYFSRRDAIEVTKTFIAKLDFRGLDVVLALRRLFDSFKPGGESQVITRILEFFAETYLVQWQEHPEKVSPRVAFASSDSVLQVAVSLIMLNTGIHVVSRKVTKRSNQRNAGQMSVEEYIKNTRLVVGETEVSNEALKHWYEAVKAQEISVEPLPRVQFSTLPVQPDIQGWLIALLGPRVRHRLWGVMALQRLYLFSDTDEVEPGSVIDLRTTNVGSTWTPDQAMRKRLMAEFKGGGIMGFCCALIPEDLEMRNGGGLLDRAFELRTVSAGPNDRPPPITIKGFTPRENLILAAETQDLAGKWVDLIETLCYANAVER